MSAELRLSSELLLLAGSEMHSKESVPVSEAESVRRETLGSVRSVKDMTVVGREPEGGGSTDYDCQIMGSSATKSCARLAPFASH